MAWNRTGTHITALVGDDVPAGMTVQDIIQNTGRFRSLAGTIPPGITIQQTYNVAPASLKVTGTFTAPGNYTTTITHQYGTAATTWDITEPATEPTTIPVPVPERTDTGYVLPAAEGVTWTVDGAIQAPGTYTVTVGTEPETRTILPSPDVGYVFDAEPEPITFTYEPKDPPMDATLPITTIPMGQEVEVTLSPLFSLFDSRFIITGDLPPGITATPSPYTGAHTLSGTATEAGTWRLELQGRDELGDYTDTVHTLDLVVMDPDAPEVIPAPAAERTEDGYMLPDVPGVRWLVDGVETAPGSYSVEPVTEPTTVTITPEALDGYLFDPPAVDLVLTFTPAPDPEPEPDPDPDPGPTPDPEPVGPFTPTPAPDEPDEPTEAAWARLMDDDPQAVYVATKLAERIIRHTGQDVDTLEPTEVLTARDHAVIVLEYVRGYVRGRGFVGYIPHRSLQAVIVSAGARLFINPEQLTYYSTGDYSERPATLTGWTAAELGVLRRFRRTYR